MKNKLYLTLIINIIIIIITAGCTYQKSKEHSTENALKKESKGYVTIRINKCYTKYLKNLYFSYYNRPESDDIKELIFYMQYLSDIESESISKFTTLSEKTKLSILSYIQYKSTYDIEF